MSVTSDTCDRMQKSLRSLESTLHQSWLQVTGLISEFNFLRSETNSYKTELLTLKERCNKQNCSGSEALSKVIESKESTLCSAVSILKKYLNTNDINCINELLKLLCIERTTITPPKSQDRLVSPSKNANAPVESATFTMDVSIDDESISEIEGTPTGRKSPIFQPRTKGCYTSLLNGTEIKEKKKCPENWPTPPKKSYKTTARTPAQGKTRLRQQRLNLSKLNTSAVVDLTSSPEFSGGRRTQNHENGADIKPLIKKELLENDETILPSPTSGPPMFSSTLYKTVSKDSPAKKKPSLKLKRESDENEKHKTSEVRTLEFNTDMEESINLLNQQRNRFKKPTVKYEVHDPNQTDCENKFNTSLQKEVNKLEIKLENNKQNMCDTSPTKRPLVENINVTNVDCDLQASLSLLHPDANQPDLPPDNERQIKLNIEPVYKEPTVRKKVEKRALPGWSCDECRIFYDELYKNDPEMLAKLMNECSKHRGKKNPARPKTPEGFWNPRWSVPDDTEEFNKQNNVA